MFDENGYPSKKLIEQLKNWDIHPLQTISDKLQYKIHLDTRNKIFLGVDNKLWVQVRKKVSKDTISQLWNYIRDTFSKNNMSNISQSIKNEVKFDDK